MHLFLAFPFFQFSLSVSAKFYRTSLAAIIKLIFVCFIKSSQILSFGIPPNFDVFHFVFRGLSRVIGTMQSFRKWIGEKLDKDNYILPPKKPQIPLKAGWCPTLRISLIPLF